jgi:hypothetical protein
MRHLLVIVLLWITVSPVLRAICDYDNWFTNRTLRLDLTLSGDSVNQHISLDELLSQEGWAGRRRHLDSLCLMGNGQIYVRDSASQKLIYCTSFSSLFQEWQNTPEALRRSKSFENSFYVPFPRHAVTITVQLRDSWQRVTSSTIFDVSPTDILIRNLDAATHYPYREVLKSGPVDSCVDIAFVAEGYRADQMETFYRDVDRVCRQLFTHEPFRRMKRRFNVYAVAAPSHDEGTSEPVKGIWKSTVLGSSFDTFYSDRYLTTLHVKRLYDALTGVPCDAIIVLVNSDKYGGGGIYNLYMLSSAHHKWSLPVCVHEFGHSFAGLADEYDYGDGSSEYYHQGVEPWEPNITTLADFKSKWSNMLLPGTPIPTPKSDCKETQYTRVGVFEGAGYMCKGVYRPAQECRMKVNDVPAFCPVCQRAIERMIRYYTE